MQWLKNILKIFSFLYIAQIQEKKPGRVAQREKRGHLIVAIYKEIWTNKRN